MKKIISKAAGAVFIFSWIICAGSMEAWNLKAAVIAAAVSIACIAVIRQECTAENDK